jgi:hypothetical protein
MSRHLPDSGVSRTEITGNTATAAIRTDSSGTMTAGNLVENMAACRMRVADPAVRVKLVLQWMCSESSAP